MERRSLAHPVLVDLGRIDLVLLVAASTRTAAVGDDIPFIRPMATHRHQAGEEGGVGDKALLMFTPTVLGVEGHRLRPQAGADVGRQKHWLLIAHLISLSRP